MSVVWATAAFAAFLVASVVLAVVDVRTRRLPDAIVLPGIALAVALLGAAALADHRPDRALGVVVAASALFAAHLALHVARPGAWGGGDVKLAGLIGAHLGWFGPEATLAGALSGVVLGGAAGLGALSVRGAGQVALGPCLLAGAWWAILAAVTGAW